MTTTGWETRPGDFPWPPANVQAWSPMSRGVYDLRWDDPSTLATGKESEVVQATGSIIVTGTPDVEATATGSLTVTGTPATGSVIVIGEEILTAFSGTRHPGLNDYDCSLPTTGEIVADIVDALNDAANDFQDLVSASVAGPVVSLVSAVVGEGGNDVALVTDSAAITLSDVSLTGGRDAATITVGDTVSLTAVSGARTSGSDDFSVDGNTFDIAISIADALNDSGNSFGSFVSASADYGEVTLTAIPIGIAGNDVAIETNSSVFTLSGEELSGGAGDERCLGRNNSRWNIVGINIYRSDDGERGPYKRVTKFPVGTLRYRDQTNLILVEREIVQWDGAWIAKGDSANDRRWTFRTRYTPIVKAGTQGIHANSPSDVVVTIGGEIVPVDTVYGPTGDVTLINQRTWDSAREKAVEPLLPSDDGTTEVTVTYRYQGNIVDGRLDKISKIWYRLTTVAIDTTGTSPSGLVETPLGYSPPVSPMQVEAFDYMWREAVRRNRFILEQGGERVKVFLKKNSGVRCWCRPDTHILELQQQFDLRCPYCFGTGWVGGYEGPYDMIIAPDDADRRVTQTPNGRRLEHNYEVWTGPSPSLTQRDFIVKQTGERYAIGPIRRPAIRGLPLQQHFTIEYIDEGDVRHNVPVVGLEDLAWPETRYTNPEESACQASDPFPVGAGYRAAPMGTEVPKIPDEREQRGRTPAWQQVMYGGKGT